MSYKLRKAQCSKHLLLYFFTMYNIQTHSWYSLYNVQYSIPTHSCCSLYNVRCTYTSAVNLHTSTVHFTRYSILTHSCCSLHKRQRTITHSRFLAHNAPTACTHLNKVQASLRYRNTWQHVDGTIAYFARLQGYYYRVGCAFLSSRLMNHLAAYFSCATHYDAGYLCEIDAKTPSVENTTGVMKLPDPQTQETYGVRTTPCPEGHLTHEFLACDVQSSCWAHAAVTCGALMELINTTLVLMKHHSHLFSHAVSQYVDATTFGFGWLH